MSPWHDEFDVEGHEERGGDLVWIGSRESILSLELALAMIHSARDLSYRVDAPLEIPRGESLAWLKKHLERPYYASQYDAWLRAAQRYCESPIELLMLLGLWISLIEFEIPVEIVTAEELRTFPELKDRFCFAQIVLQQPFEKYRIDVALHLNARIGNEKIRQSVAFECDGAAYHGPDRAAHDEAKNEALRSSGYWVFRASGKKIWHELELIAREIRTTISLPFVNRVYQACDQARTQQIAQAGGLHV